MEGDAGESGQLNPTDSDGSSEPSGDGHPQAGGAPTSNEVVPEKGEDAATDSGAGSSEDDPLGSPEEPAGSPEEEIAHDSEAATPAASSRPPSRFGRAWVVGVAAALILLSAGVVTGGYFAMRAHKASVAQAHADAIALAAAKDCVAATQAPDAAAMVASQQKIIDCSTGDFAVQATVFSGVMVDAYQAANVQVKVSDMRAAVEQHNDDGSIQVLVAVRIKVTNSAATDQEEGYRLRVKMAPADGTYKIARLDQVAS